MSLKMTVNNKKVFFEKEKTILEIAKDNDIYIPSLCYHYKTGPAGKCRVCMVDVEGMRGLQAACTTIAADGMVVKTNTTELLEAQKMIVNLLLSNGQHNCLSCEATGDCELQDVAYYLGIETPAFIIESAPPEVDDSSEMIVFDHRKCIQCGRCIEADNCTVVQEVLGFGFRALQTKVICDEDLPMGQSSCVQCGECSQLCPVGAIIDKKSIGKGRPWELRNVDTVCPYCGVGCQITLHIHEKTNRIVKISGVEKALPNDGMLCVKGRYGYDFVNSQERLTTPLIRKNGQFQEATWEEAVSLVANTLHTIKETHGSNAIAGLSSAKVSNEENFAFQKFMRKEMGTNNVDHCARL